MQHKGIWLPAPKTISHGLPHKRGAPLISGVDKYFQGVI